MRIDGSVPTHVARAYGLKLVRPFTHAPTPTAQPAQVLKATDATPPSKSLASTASIAPTTAPKPSGKVDQLIAGRASGPVDFTSGPRVASSADALPLYTRSADCVEAATAVQLGWQIDVKG